MRSHSMYDKLQYLLWVLALSSVILYCLVASSEEFRAFAPFPVSDVFFYLFTVLMGVFAGFVIRIENTVFRLLLTSAAFLIPVVIYGSALVLFWAEIGGWGLLDFFILQAGRRMIIYFAFVGFLGLLGVAVGVVLEETVG